MDTDIDIDANIDIGVNEALSPSLSAYIYIYMNIYIYIYMYRERERECVCVCRFPPRGVLLRCVRASVQPPSCRMDAWRGLIVFRASAVTATNISSFYIYTAVAMTSVAI